MSSDNQYTALGPAAVGFQTDGANIDRGAEIAGNTFGVKGRCQGSGGHPESLVNLGKEMLMVCRALATETSPAWRISAELAMEQVCLASGVGRQVKAFRASALGARTRAPRTRPVFSATAATEHLALLGKRGLALPTAFKASQPETSLALRDLAVLTRVLAYSAWVVHCLRQGSLVRESEVSVAAARIPFHKAPTA
jgi:hypothetical protein